MDFDPEFEGRWKTFNERWPLASDRKFSSVAARSIIDRRLEPIVKEINRYY